MGRFPRVSTLAFLAALGGLFAQADQSESTSASPTLPASERTQASPSNINLPIGPWMLPTTPRVAGRGTSVLTPVERQPRKDDPLRRVQATSGDMNIPGGPGAVPLPQPSIGSSTLSIPATGGQSISMQTALYGALTGNPDLVTMRQGNALAVSAEAVEVARHFPTTLNPTLWMDYRPITLVPNGTFGTNSPGSGANRQNGFYHFGQDFFYISLRQPIELGHQTTHRFHIAEAAYDQQRWLVIQAELTALVQTYRFFQTAAYRREKYRLAQQLADFNDRLLKSLQRRMVANQVQAADVELARLESLATRQQIKAARQDYLTGAD